MAGYADAYIRGLMPLIQMRRMQDAEQAQAQGYALRLQQAQDLERERMRQDEDRNAGLNRQNRALDLQNYLGVENLRLRQDEMRRKENEDRRKENEDRRRAAEQAAKDKRMLLEFKRGGKLQPGYRWKSDNPDDPMALESELIPGGGAWQKQKGDHAGDLAKLESINNATAAIVSRIGSILRPSNRGGFEANFGMIPEVATRYLPGENYDTLNEIHQLQAMLKTAGLGDIRGRSGQSIGAITEKEWQTLADQIARLGVGMSDEAALRELSNIRRQMLNLRNKEYRAYSQEWQGTPFYQKNPIPIPAMHEKGKMAGVPKTFAHGQEVWDNLTDEEKELWLPGISKK